VARTSPCTTEIRRGRLRKAIEFFDAAILMEDHADEEVDTADVVVTLCVHAGIAASDVICRVRLGQYTRGDDHGEAVALLGKAASGSAKHLRVLLSMKTKAEYSHSSVTASDTKRAVRAAEALTETARRVSAI
jgi:hypothetical protein